MPLKGPWGSGHTLLLTLSSFTESTNVIYTIFVYQSLTFILVTNPYFKGMFFHILPINFLAFNVTIFF